MRNTENHLAGRERWGSAECGKVLPARPEFSHHKTRAGKKDRGDDIDGNFKII